MRRMTVVSLGNFNPDSLQCNRGVSSETLKPMKMRHAVCSSRGHRPAALHCTQHSLCNHAMMLAGDGEILKEKKPFCGQTLAFDSFKSPSGTRPSPLLLFDIADDDPENLSTVQVGVPSP